MGILLTPLAKQPIDAHLAGFSEEEALAFEARHHRVTDAEVKRLRTGFDNGRGPKCSMCEDCLAEGERVRRALATPAHPPILLGLEHKTQPAQPVSTVGASAGVAAVEASRQFHVGPAPLPHLLGLEHKTQPAQPMSTVGASAGAAATEAARLLGLSEGVEFRIGDVQGVSGQEARDLLSKSSMFHYYGLLWGCEDFNIKTESEGDFVVILPPESPVQDKDTFKNLTDELAQ